MSYRPGMELDAAELAVWRGVVDHYDDEPPMTERVDVVRARLLLLRPVLAEASAKLALAVARAAERLAAYSASLRDTEPELEEDAGTLPPNPRHPSLYDGGGDIPS